MRSLRLIPLVAVAAAAVGLAVAVGPSAQAASPSAGASSGTARGSVKAPDGTPFTLKLAAGPVLLPATGGTVRVRGHGYDERQSIVLAFCVVPDGVRVGKPSTYTTAPSVCLPGRATRDGSSRRISNTATGTPGITIPYAPNGSFDTTLNLRPEIADGVVCGRTVTCAIVTRADFTAPSVRAFDQYIPVTFAGAQRR